MKCLHPLEVRSEEPEILICLCVQVVFAGFSSEALSQRIMDCKPKVVLTCNAVRRGPKVINLKEIVDTALTDSAQNGTVVGNYVEDVPF